MLQFLHAEPQAPGGDLIFAFQGAVEQGWIVGVQQKPALTRSYDVGVMRPGTRTAGPKKQPTTWCCGDLTTSDPLLLVQNGEFRRFQRYLMARRSLASGDIPSRSRQVTRAWEILQELAHTLDHEKGGEISRSRSPARHAL